MRIRKSEKLFGFTSEYRRAPSPPTPWDSAAAIVAAAGLLCEINRSSCAEVSINLQSSNNQKKELEIANEEQEAEMGIAGKNSDDKEEEVKPEEKIGDNEEIKNEKEPARKRREKEVEATGMTKCKKMNDEGCHCNLSQLSSYLPPSEERISGDDRGSVIASNSSDDYCVLGIDSREATSRGNKSSGLDDQFDHEAMADGLNVADEEAIGSANLCNFNYKKKMKPLKKRGRKPMKARSLKSLLSFKVC